MTTFFGSTETPFSAPALPGTIGSSTQLQPNRLAPRPSAEPIVEESSPAPTPAPEVPNGQENFGRRFPVNANIRALENQISRLERFASRVEAEDGDVEDRVESFFDRIEDRVEDIFDRIEDRVDAFFDRIEDRFEDRDDDDSEEAVDGEVAAASLPTDDTALALLNTPEGLDAGGNGAFIPQELLPVDTAGEENASVTVEQPSAETPVAAVQTDLDVLLGLDILHERLEQLRALQGDDDIISPSDELLAASLDSGIVTDIEI